MERYARKSSNTTLAKIKRALLSASDKTNLVHFAQALHRLGVVLLATGGTAKLLRDAQLPIQEVSDVTGFPEILDGRVKTLHPHIHAGILSRRGQDDATLTEHGIASIDLVVCNLYPFSQTIEKPGCTREHAIENIDIGGPTMLRASAKNHAFVTVICDPKDYTSVLDEIEQNEGSTLASTRAKLAQKVFAHTAEYDHCIASYLSEDNPSPLPKTWQPRCKRYESLRYGENPQQAAALYRYQDGQDQGSLAHATLHQGKALSFNNLIDADAAARCVTELDPNQAACAIIKHATPCGVGQANHLLTAYEKAWQCDSQSAFGGIIAFNQNVDAETLAKIFSQQFAEVIIAPAFSQEALTLAKQKPNLRLLATGSFTSGKHARVHHISGGLLLQTEDISRITQQELNIVSQKQPSATELQDALFAWHIVKHVKSNAIVYAKDGQTLGIGSGQTSRVFSAEIAALKAKQAHLNLQGCAMASDAFFPFADGLQIGINAGATTIIQPGGSKRDAEVIAAADAAGVCMIMTGLRHFRH